MSDQRTKSCAQRAPPVRAPALWETGGSGGQGSRPGVQPRRGALCCRTPLPRALLTCNARPQAMDRREKQVQARYGVTQVDPAITRHETGGRRERCSLREGFIGMISCRPEDSTLRHATGLHAPRAALRGV